jgi:hypothetical protein
VYFYQKLAYGLISTIKAGDYKATCYAATFNILFGVFICWILLRTTSESGYNSDNVCLSEIIKDWRKDMVLTFRYWAWAL